MNQDKNKMLMNKPPSSSTTTTTNTNTNNTNNNATNSSLFTSSSISNFNMVYAGSNTSNSKGGLLNSNSSTSFYPNPILTQSININTNNQLNKTNGISSSLNSIPPPPPPPMTSIPLTPLAPLNTFYNKPAGSYSNGTFTYVPPVINFHQNPTVNLNLLNTNKYAHFEQFRLQQQMQQRGTFVLNNNSNNNNNTNNRITSSRPNSAVILDTPPLVSSEQEYLDKGFLNLLKSKNSLESANVDAKKKHRNKNLIDLNDDTPNFDLNSMSVFDLFDPLTIKEKSEKKQEPVAPFSDDDDEEKDDDVTSKQSKEQGMI
jgi:hypothetical protein